MEELQGHRADKIYLLTFPVRNVGKDLFTVALKEEKRREWRDIAHLLPLIIHTTSHDNLRWHIGRWRSID